MTWASAKAIIERGGKVRLPEWKRADQFLYMGLGASVMQHRTGLVGFAYDYTPYPPLSVAARTDWEEVE